MRFFCPRKSFSEMFESLFGRLVGWLVRSYVDVLISNSLPSVQYLYSTYDFSLFVLSSLCDDLTSRLQVTFISTEKKLWWTVFGQRLFFCRPLGGSKAIFSACLPLLLSTNLLLLPSSHVFRFILCCFIICDSAEDCNSWHLLSSSLSLFLALCLKFYITKSIHLNYDQAVLRTGVPCFASQFRLDIFWKIVLTVYRVNRSNSSSKVPSSSSFCFVQFPHYCFWQPYSHGHQVPMLYFFFFVIVSFFCSSLWFWPVFTPMKIE